MHGSATETASKPDQTPPATPLDRRRPRKSAHGDRRARSRDTALRGIQGVAVGTLSQSTAGGVAMQDLTPKARGRAKSRPLGSRRYLSPRSFDPEILFAQPSA